MNLISFSELSGVGQKLNKHKHKSSLGNRENPLTMTTSKREPINYDYIQKRTY